MSPVLNCIPSSPPSDQTSYPKGGSAPSSDGSNRSPPEIVSSQPQNGDFTESENSCCDDVRIDGEDSKLPSPTNNNNNSIPPPNFKMSPSPNESLAFEPPIRPWNSSPNYGNAERDQSVSPSSSSHQGPSPRRRNSVSPDVSSENSRIPSRASSEAANEPAFFPDAFRSLKMCSGEIPYEVTPPFPFHDNRLSTDSFRISNSFANDPVNPYFRLTGHTLNPFQPSPEYLGNSFLGANDPKLLLGNPGLGLITQQLHHLNGLSATVNKIPPTELQRMSMQQLQFLQSHLQSLPGLLQPSPYAKFSDPKSQLSMLMQARKHPKSSETNSENVGKDVFAPIVGKPEEEANRLMDGKIKQSIDPFAARNRKLLPESIEVDNYEENNSDSDELLSVGSVSPPPPTKCQARTDPPGGKQNDECLSGANSSPGKFPNRTNNPNGSKKYPNASPAVRPQQSGGPMNTKTANASNRTLKFSIDNILKSDFGSEDVIANKEPKLIESKKHKESERTSAGKKKPETEKEKPVDLSPENNANAATVPGAETPMLWPAWVYCTRYSDRPSSGPRTRRTKNKEKNPEEKRPRTAFSGDQLSKLKHEFAENRYLTERRRQDLARELGLNEAQIKIWFQNKRAKMKKARGEKNPLALQLMAQGLYNHSTIPLTKEEEEAAAAEMSD